MRELDEDVYRTAEELGIDISRPERGSDEEDARRAAERSFSMARRQRFRPASDRSGHRRRHPLVVQRRGEEARDHQLPHAPPGKGRPVLREDLRSDQGLGVLLRQVQAGALQGDHLRALRRRGHALEGPPRAHGPHRARRSGRAHLVPPRHPLLARLPAHGHRGPRGAEGQAAREGHLLRGLPRHLGRRGEAPRRPAQPRGRAARGDRRDRAAPRPRHRAALQGARGRARRAREGRRQGHRDQGPPAHRREGDRRGARAGRRTRHELAQRALDELKNLFARKIIEDELLWRELQRPLRRLLRGRHGRRGDRAAHRPDRPRRGRDQAPRT